MSGIQGVMSFEVFAMLLRAAEMLVLVAVTGPAVGLALFIPAVAIELNAVNINLLIVGAVLVGFRYPMAWAFIILTKVTPGRRIAVVRRPARMATPRDRRRRHARVRRPVVCRRSPTCGASTSLALA